MKSAARELRTMAPALAVLAIIAVLTLRPVPDQAPQAALTPISCLVCGSLGGVDVILNVLLFLPLGLALRRAPLRLPTIAAIGLTVSVGIETLQLFAIPGRDASVSDLVTNSLGMMAGWALGGSWRRFVSPPPATALRIATAYAVIWASVWAAAAALLHPAPPPGAYYGQWAHEFGAGRTQWLGRVTAARLNGLPIPDGHVPDEPLRDALAHGDFTLELFATSGVPSDSVAQIFGLASERGEIFVEWTQHRRDVRFRIRYGASSLRLRSPVIRLDSAAPSAPGQPLHLIARERDGVLSAESRTSRDTAVATHSLTPSLNWTFAAPFAYHWGPETRWVTMIWVMVTLTPLGYWGTIAASPRMAAIAVAGAAGAGLALGPLVGQLRKVDWREALAVGLAWGLGALLSRYATRGPSTRPQILMPSKSGRRGGRSRHGG